MNEIRLCFNQLLEIRNPDELPKEDRFNYIMLRYKIAAIIDMIPDLRKRVILTDRYINRKKISELSDIHYYSERQIINIINSGLTWVSLNYRGELPCL